MPPRPMLRIAEIFASVLGEGLRLGEATIFVRLAGCNLRCSFCDTKSAWDGGRPATVARVLAAVRGLQKKRPASWVCLTGGEPMIQDIGPLVGRLRAEGWKVQIETNGTVRRPIPFDWITVSPKPPGYESDPRLRRRAREVKLIVTGELTLAAVRRLRTEFPVRVPIFLQPESNAEWSRAKAMRLFGRATGEGRPNIRLGVQLHKIFGIP